MSKLLRSLIQLAICLACILYGIATGFESVLSILIVVVGLIFLCFSIKNAIAGVRALRKRAEISRKGSEEYGIVAEIRDVAGQKLGSPIQVVDVGVRTSPNTIRHFRTELNIGEQYDVGDYVCVKLFDNAICVERLAETTEVPSATLNLLKYYPMFWGKGYVGEYLINDHSDPNLSVVTIDGKSYNVCFTYETGIDEGFYRGESGMFYTEDKE